MFTEDTEIQGLKIKKDTTFLIAMWSLHHNPKEWKSPEKYIPERFDPTSEWYLTPDGKKRHPMSFGPFLGGRRICLGKTFAEIVSKVVGPSFINLLDLEFVDKYEINRKKVTHSTDSLTIPKLMVKGKINPLIK